MNICHKHPHSSTESARRCYEQRMRQRANRALKHVDLSYKKYEQLEHKPPLRVSGVAAEIFHFFSARQKP